MKWLFILLLIGNVTYLGWEIDRETRLQIQRQTGNVRIPGDAERLLLLHELAETPPPKSSGSARGSLPQGPAPGFIDITSGEQTDSTTDLVTTMPEPVNVDHDHLLLDMVKPFKPRNRLPEGTRVACFTYGPFAQAADVTSLRHWFQQRGQPIRERSDVDQNQQLYWVYLSPPTDKADALATLTELKDQGIKDTRLIRKGSFKNAISLGLFSSQAGVNRRLSELNARGYQPVVVPYNEDGQTSLYWLDVALDVESPVMTEAFTGLPARFNSVPKDCNQIALNVENP